MRKRRCLLCGKKALEGSRYCSETCENEVKQVLIEKFNSTKCVVCGNYFYYRTKKSKLCSIKCRNIYAGRRKKITHYDIFERDGFRCQYCGQSPADGVKGLELKIRRRYEKIIINTNAINYSVYGVC